MPFQARESEQRGGGGGYGGGYGRDMGRDAPTAAELEEEVASIQKTLQRTKVSHCALTTGYTKPTTALVQGDAF